MQGAVNSATGTVAALKIGAFAGVFAFFEYFGIPGEPFVILGALMFIDFLSGIGKAYVLQDEITSHKGWLGFMRKVMTLIALLSCALAIKGVGYNGAFTMTVIISGLIAAELYSIIQNVVSIRTGKKLSEWDATSFVFRTLLKFLRSRVESEAQSITVNIDEQPSTPKKQ